MNDSQPTILGWLAKLAISIFVAGMWTQVVQIIWMGAMILAYGSLDSFLSDFRPLKTAFAFTLAYGASYLASFFGGVIGPMVLGFRPARTRWPVVSSSGTGAIISALVAVAIGTSVGSLVNWQDIVKEGFAAFMLIILVISLPAGLLGGWIGGLAMRRPTDPD